MIKTEEPILHFKNLSDCKQHFTVGESCSNHQLKCKEVEAHKSLTIGSKAETRIFINICPAQESFHHTNYFLYLPHCSNENNNQILQTIY